MGRTWIGISGWRYGPWRGTFYPAKWPQKRELEYAGSKFNSVEINGSFYSLQRPDSYAAWYDQTPKDFAFAVKGGRFITHMMWRARRKSEGTLSVVLILAFRRSRLIARCIDREAAMRDQRRPAIRTSLQNGSLQADQGVPPQCLATQRANDDSGIPLQVPGHYVAQDGNADENHPEEERKAIARNGSRRGNVGHVVSVDGEADGTNEEDQIKQQDAVARPRERLSEVIFHRRPSYQLRT